MSRLTDPLLGRQIGSYLLQDLLGEGGMARVYLGKHHEDGTSAAIKVFEADRFSDAADAERFRREGRNMFRLRHENIVKFLEFGVVEDLYYLVVEYVDGADLGWVLSQYRLRKQSLPMDDILAISEQVARALDYVHREGMVHRDVKPSNILITRDGQALLTDFGLALSALESTHGTVFGSALYVAPEQAIYSGDAAPQSDIYSLGAVLYEMLAGSPPFEAETPIAVVLKHLNETPSPPASLPEPLVEVVLKSLAKEPEQRYATVTDLVGALSEAYEQVRAEVSDQGRSKKKAAPARKAAPDGLALAGSGENPSVVEVIDRRPPLLDRAGRVGSSARRARSNLLRPGRLALIVSAILLGAFCAVSAAAAARGGDLWTGLRGRWDTISTEAPAEGGAANAAGPSRGEEAGPSGDEETRGKDAQGVKAGERETYMNQVSCSGYPIVSRLKPGLYAYAVRPTPLYDTPRTEHNEAVNQVIRVVLELQPGDRVLILNHESYPNCYQEAHFLKVRTETGVEGWAHEWRWQYYLRP